MERFLLFDSGCAVCSELAREIEHESGGWMMVRSLRDLDPFKEVKALATSLVAIN